MHIGLVDLRWSGHHTPYVVYLSRYFTDRGHEVTFITDERHEHLDELPNTEDLTIQTLSISDQPSNTELGLLNSLRGQTVRTRQIRSILEMITDVNVDVLHFLYFDSTQIPFRLATLRRSPDPPVIMTLHRDAFLSSSQGNLIKRTTQLATTLALDSCLSTECIKYLTVHADSMRNRIIGAVDSATRNNTRTVPAPTPNIDIDGSPTELRLALDLPEEKDVLLFFGALRYEKGPDLLAEVAKDIERPLTIVFAGPSLDFTEDDVKRWKRSIEPPLKIVDRIEYIPESEVDKYFAAADALVLPYRRTRGISGPLRRSAMAGTPIIGRNQSDIGDIIERYGLGATFDLDDTESFEKSLVGILDTELDLSDNLYKFALTRHWTKTGAVFVDIYEEAIEDTIAKFQDT